MTHDNFSWLQKWCQIHCDGNWEHGNSIHLRTIDNPGWSLSINLEETELENRKFHQLDINRSDKDWTFCEIRDVKFEARCGVNNLPEVLKVFRHWAQSSA